MRHISTDYRAELQADSESALYWRTRALAAEVEVKDLCCEVQTLQYLIESLTERVARQSECLSELAERPGVRERVAA